jgi:hypothetical protein
MKNLKKIINHSLKMKKNEKKNLSKKKKIRFSKNKNKINQIYLK